MFKNFLLICLSSILLFACEAEEENTGTETAGTETAGAEMAGAETAGTETAGTETAGTETAGAEMAGAETAGTETAGTEMTDTETAWTEPADLVRDVNAVGASLIAERDTYCENCAMTEVCGDEFSFDNSVSESDAGCIFIESTSEELGSLQAFNSCLQANADEANACIAALNMCDDSQFEGCLELYNDNECGMLVSFEYVSRIDVACFGGAEDFICDDGTAIPGDYVCDTDADCADGEDEVDCSEE